MSTGYAPRIGAPWREGLCNQVYDDHKAQIT